MESNAITPPRVGVHTRQQYEAPPRVSALPETSGFPKDQKHPEWSVWIDETKQGSAKEEEL